MKIVENGIMRDMTAEEIAAMEAEAAKFEAYERTRHLTSEEVTAMLIRQQINTWAVLSSTAKLRIDFFDIIVKSDLVFR